MKVIVVGAGIVGVAAAYRLSEDGHQVTVIERREGPALETSFANGGQLGASVAAPWAGPEVPLQVLKWLGRQDAPLKVRPKLDPDQWRWLWQFLKRCRKAPHVEATLDNIRLALLSRQEFDRLHKIAGRPGQEKAAAATYQDRGILRLLKTPGAGVEAERQAERERAQGLALTVLSAADCVDLEPALASAHQRGEIAGGVYCPDDRSGDAHLFTQELEARAIANGVQFSYGISVAAWRWRSNRIDGVETSHGYQPADAFVLSSGVQSAALARQLGLSLPIYPVKGYSVTLPVRTEHEPGVPSISLADEERKIVVSRFGDRLRAAGQAEIVGYDTTLDETRARSVLNALQSLFPSSGDAEAAEFWCGLRPMTPDGRPLIGRALPWDNLYLNTGHGTLGWTQAHGSAAVIADILADRQPAVSIDNFGLSR